jgi:hypothetical protein
MWSKTGADLSVEGRLVDHGDIPFDSVSDPWDLIDRDVGRAMQTGDPLICLDGESAIAVAQLHGLHARSAQIDCDQKRREQSASSFSTSENELRVLPNVP